MTESCQESCPLDDRRILLDDRRESLQGWHLKKEVNLSIIVAILMLGLSGIAAYYDLKRDIALLQSDTLTLHKADERAVDNQHDLAQTFTSHLERIDAKLDRLIERGQK